MFKAKKFLVLLASVMMFSVIFTGCQNEEKPATQEAEDTNKDKVDVESDIKDLSTWKGTWNNMGAYLEDEEIQEAYTKLAEEEGITAEEAKKAYLEKRHADFDGLIVEDNKVTYLDGFKDKDGKEIAQVEYAYKETKKVPRGDSELTWHVFESEEEGAYKVLLMMEMDDEDALTHFHMRYGKDLDEVLAKEKWFPTFIATDSTHEQLYEEIAE